MQYEELASNKAQTNRGELNEDIEHTMAAISLGKRREREEQLANGMPQCLLSQVPFSDDEIAAMVVDWTSDDFNLHRVVALRDAAVVAPSAPSFREQAALMSQPGAYIPAANPSGPIRDWVRLVCAHRKHFHGCAILGSVGGQPKAFALLYAMQRPLLVALCPMDLLRKTMPVFKNMSLEQQKAFLQNSFLHEFVSRECTTMASPLTTRRGFRSSGTWCFCLGTVSALTLALFLWRSFAHPCPKPLPPRLPARPSKLNLLMP